MTTPPLQLGAVARLAVTATRHATVRWRDPDDGGSVVATATVTSGADGCLVIRLEPGSPVARGIHDHPVVAVVVAAGDPWRAVELEGVAHRVPHPAGAPALFRLAPSGVLLRGEHDHDVPVAAYFAAGSMWAAAARVVDHLATTHAVELGGFLRRHGLAGAQAAVPVALDAYGLSLVALLADGTTTVRIGFPRPASGVHDALTTLRSMLACDR